MYLAAVNWQEVGYIYRMKIATEMYGVTFDTKRRIAHRYCVGRESLRKGTLFEIKRMRTELGRQQFKGPLIWNSCKQTSLKMVILQHF